MCYREVQLNKSAGKVGVNLGSSGAYLGLHRISNSEIGFLGELPCLSSSVLLVLDLCLFPEFFLWQLLDLDLPERSFCVEGLVGGLEHASCFACWPTRSNKCSGLKGDARYGLGAFHVCGLT